MSPDDRRLKATRRLAPSFLGLTKVEATARSEEQGILIRWVDLDEMTSGRFVLTADLRSDRLTLYVRAGLVFQAKAG